MRGIDIHSSLPVMYNMPMIPPTRISERSSNATMYVVKSDDATAPIFWDTAWKPVMLLSIVTKKTRKKTATATNAFLFKFLTSCEHQGEDKKRDYCAYINKKLNACHKG